MKKLPIILMMLPVMAGCFKTQPGTNVNVGDNLPEFMVTMNDGLVTTEKDFSQGVGLLAFFHTQCSDCVKELPELQKIWEKYQVFINFCPISREEGRESIIKYWKANNFNMPFSPQEDRAVYNKFSNSGIPLVFIVKDGVVKQKWTDVHVPTFEEMDDFLQSLDITTE